MDESETKQLITTTKAKAILDAQAGRITGPLRWLLVDLALATGLRASEMTAIKISDIDLKRSLIRITRLKKKKPTAESLAISKELTKHLKNYLKGTTQEFLFIGKKGPMTVRGLQQLWQAAIREANLPKELSIHSARHTIAVRLLKKTKNLRQVQKQLGHSSPATTANMYADISFEDMQNGLNGLYK